MKSVAQNACRGGLKEPIAFSSNYHSESSPDTLIIQQSLFTRAKSATTISQGRELLHPRPYTPLESSGKSSFFLPAE
jgi:hypothetical protein